MVCCSDFAFFEIRNKKNRHPGKPGWRFESQKNKLELRDFDGAHIAVGVLNTYHVDAGRQIFYRYFKFL